MKELAGLRILVVEDDEDSRFLLTLFLRVSGADVKACQSASEALHSFRRSQPDIILCDIMMPEHDGYWLMKQVRGLRPETPAIALTAKSGDDDRAASLNAGFQLHLSKPAISDRLIKAIRELAETPLERRAAR
jgi:CheY-like chemotaxis protein